MVHGAIQQLLRDTLWGELDYLVIDLPPGTGDAQLTIVQSVPLAGVVFVTTPQAVSLLDGAKGIQMFQKLHVPVLGLIENMSGFQCPHCQEVTNIFSKGGGENDAKKYGISYLGAVPLDPAIVECGDSGRPVVVSYPNSLSAKTLMSISDRIAANISINQFETRESAAVRQ
jgi:ATP-binding protein involved in chromosome partitioning